MKLFYVFSFCYSGTHMITGNKVYDSIIVDANSYEEACQIFNEGVENLHLTEVSFQIEVRPAWKAED